MISNLCLRIGIRTCLRTDIDGMLGQKIALYLDNDHVAQTFLCCTCVAVPYLCVGRLCCVRGLTAVGYTTERVS